MRLSTLNSHHYDEVRSLALGPTLAALCPLGWSLLLKGDNFPAHGIHLRALCRMTCSR